jgi:hypothetical protein
VITGLFGRPVSAAKGARAGEPWQGEHWSGGAIVFPAQFMTTVQEALAML